MTMTLMRIPTGPDRRPEILDAPERRGPKTLISQLIALHADGKLPLEKLEKRYSLDEIGQAADDMHRGVTVKPVIVF